MFKLYYLEKNISNLLEVIRELTIEIMFFAEVVKSLFPK